MIGAPGLVKSAVIALLAALALPGQPASGQASHGALIADNSQLATRRIAPADWKAVLVGGSHLIDSYNNAASDLAFRLRMSGVQRVAVLQSGGPVVPRGQLRRALGALGSGPDDACLVFITSHANERGIYLSTEGGFLDPRALSRIVDAECGQLPTVLILSGCGTGAFITSALTGANRVILAASAQRRVSYGAATSDRYVNFDRCLIAAMDSGVRTWRDVFDRTLPCVHERERRLGVAASQPQAWFGAQALDLVLPGRR